MPLDPQARDEQRAEARRLRSKLLDRLEHVPGPFFDRISKCGHQLRLNCGDCMERRVVESRCRWKCCPVCQRSETAATAARFAKIARRCQWPLLVTFNATHKRTDGVLAFREMRQAMTRLRAQVWWKRRVKGGFAAWEVSRLSTKERARRELGRDSGWHFHCHCLLDCRWLFATTPPPRPGAEPAERAKRIKVINEEIAALWSMAMGGRKGSIDVRRVWYDSNGGIDGAVHEVCKYAMTGADLAESEYDIAPVLWALEKTRMVAGFGSFYRHPEIKRELHRSPAMCACGCSSWVLARYDERESIDGRIAASLK